ncbi:MAG: hypothetical protein IK020_10595 [Clostridiales bacterium]|nr:hypothetical protein [Clostridiales bacterium]
MSVDIDDLSSHDSVSQRSLFEGKGDPKETGTKINTTRGQNQKEKSKKKPLKCRVSPEGNSLAEFSQIR